jgi:endonuclease/exonuclease/phosphatase family metal-dependent hydrolase
MLRQIMSVSSSSPYKYMMMKIATWNVERPNVSSKRRNEEIIAALQEVDADILILTETNSCINLGKGYNSFATPSLSLSSGVQYREDENRTTIWSKFPAKRYMKTYDEFTAICIGFGTPFGELIVYGTIIGIHGNRRISFSEDLTLQLKDWREITSIDNICVAGDFNISFGDNYYYTKEGRDKINAAFVELKMKNLTGGIKQNIDHIAISESFIKTLKYTTLIWNEDKRISDHIGVCITLQTTVS